MKSPTNKMNNEMNKTLTTAKVILAVITLSCASASIATPQNPKSYVDSITQWGAWELDIEPAAGGLKKAETRALYTRDSKVNVRTNSFSAISPAARAAGTQPPTPPPTTPPFGGPSDGFF